MEARHRVPTHLDTPDGIGPFTTRQLMLIVGTGLFVAPGAVTMVPSDPLLQGATAGVTLLVAGLFALPVEPPPEHGLTAWMRHRGQSGLLGAKAISSQVGPVEVHGAVAKSRGQLRAVWELPSLNLRLADDATRETACVRWGAFLNGLPCPVQCIVRGRPIDPESVVGAIAAHPAPEARDIAGWLRSHAIGHGLVERTRLLAISASSEDLLAQRADLITNALRRTGLPGRRLDDDELAETIQAGWSRRPVGRQVGPGSLSVESGHLVADGEHLRVLAFSRWPRAVAHDWLASILDGPLGVDLVQSITPVDTEKAQHDLDLLLRKLETTTHSRRRGVAIDDLGWLLDRLERGEERVFSVGLYVLVRAPSLRLLDERTRLLQQLVRELGADTKRLTWEHADGVASCVGTGEDRLLRRQRQVDTSSLSRAYPWGASELALAGGVPWGETLDGRRPVLWTPWRRPAISNPHLAVYGTSGSGKGFSIKVWAARALFAGVLSEVFIVDQAEEEEEGEYGRWARFVGGQVRHVSSLDQDALEAATADLHGVVVWNIAQLPLADRPRALLTMLDAVRKRAVAQPAQRWLVLDELWSFAHDTTAARSIENMIRTGRRLQVGLVAMTQRPMDALDTPIGRIIQSQAASQWYGMQLPSELSDVSARLRWTDAEVATIQRFGPGDGLLVAGAHRVAFHVTYSPAEYDIANTDGGSHADRSHHLVRRLSEPARDADRGRGGRGVAVAALPAAPSGAAVPVNGLAAG